MSIKYEDLVKQLCNWSEMYEKLKQFRPGCLYRLDFPLDDFIAKSYAVAGSDSVRLETAGFDIVLPAKYYSARVCYHILATNYPPSSTWRESLPLLQFRKVKITPLTIRDLPLYVSAPYTGPMFAEILNGKRKLKEV